MLSAGYTGDVGWVCVVLHWLRDRHDEGRGKGENVCGKLGEKTDLQTYNSVSDEGKTINKCERKIRSYGRELKDEYFDYGT